MAPAPAPQALAGLAIGNDFLDVGGGLGYLDLCTHRYHSRLSDRPMVIPVVIPMVLPETQRMTGPVETNATLLDTQVYNSQK